METQACTYKFKIVARGTKHFSVRVLTWQYFQKGLSEDNCLSCLHITSSGLCSLFVTSSGCRNLWFCSCDFRAWLVNAFLIHMGRTLPPTPISFLHGNAYKNTLTVIHLKICTKFPVHIQFYRVTRYTDQWDSSYLPASLELSTCVAPLLESVAA